MTSPSRRTVPQGLLGCGLVAAEPLSAQEHSAVLAAARKEGKVALATSVSAADFPRFLHAFAAKYPSSRRRAGSIPRQLGACWRASTPRCGRAI